jgi:hypothetical protein
MHPILAQELPGRTQAEDRALAPALKGVAKAKRIRDRALADARHLTPRTAVTRTEKILEAHRKVEAAEGRLRDAAQALAAARRSSLPDGAADLNVHPDPNCYDDRRYQVACHVGYSLISLGGCVVLGDAWDRKVWFEAELAQRGSAAHP